MTSPDNVRVSCWEAIFTKVTALQLDTLSYLRRELDLVMIRHPEVVNLGDGQLLIPWKHVSSVITTLSSRIRLDSQISTNVLSLSHQWSRSERISNVLDRIFSPNLDEFEGGLVSSDDLLSVIVPLGVLSEFSWAFDRQISCYCVMVPG